MVRGIPCALIAGVEAPGGVGVVMATRLDVQLVGLLHGQCGNLQS